MLTQELRWCRATAAPGVKLPESFNLCHHKHDLGDLPDGKLPKNTVSLLSSQRRQMRLRRARAASPRRFWVHVQVAQGVCFHVRARTGALVYLLACSQYEAASGHQRQRRSGWRVGRRRSGVYHSRRMIGSSFSPCSCLLISKQQITWRASVCLRTCEADEGRLRTRGVRRK